MSSLSIAFIVEFVMGILIGAFNQGEDNISIREGLLATALFVVVSLLTYVFYPVPYGAGTFIVLFLGWIAVSIGLLTGNAARHDLKNHFIDRLFESLAKRELQGLISEFLRLSSRLVYFNSVEDQARLTEIIAGIDRQFEQIQEKFAHLENVTCKFSGIQEICHLYYELSQTIINTQEPPELISEWTKLGDHLEQVSHKSLYYAENEIRKSVNLHNIILRALITIKGLRFV